jgi:hypothetical protein
MIPTKATAHQAGVVYFLFMIVAIIGEFFSPTFVVSGDAAATVRNITAAGLAYRLDILTGFVTLLLFIFLVERLYKLFRDVDRGQALLMVLLVTVGVSIALANMLSKFAPLVLLNGGDFLSAFTKPQLEALVLGSLEFNSQGTIVTMAFWGLWLFPFGILVINSRFFPRVLGILLLVAGLAYIIGTFTSLVLPDHEHAVGRILMPLYFGEVPIIFWLLIKGARAPQPQTQGS